MALIDLTPDDPTPVDALDAWHDNLSSKSGAGVVATLDLMIELWDSVWAESGVYSTINPETQERSGVYDPAKTIDKVAKLTLADFQILATFVQAAIAVASLIPGFNEKYGAKLSLINGPPPGWSVAEGPNKFMLATPPHEQGS